ncbi:hypothetical protein, partial [Pseudomonas sp. MWU12-2115]|uniref:hypothetical protein n=1 Tax=Pseudomonas sp. MWU12-2115 TaxID=2071713 RepID=UPI001C4981E4
MKKPRLDDPVPGAVFIETARLLLGLYLGRFLGGLRVLRRSLSLGLVGLLDLGIHAIAHGF